MSNRENKKYSPEELSKMNSADLARLGAELNDVIIAYRKERFPIANDLAEKCAARSVAIWLAPSVTLGLVFIAIYLLYSWHYKGHGEEGLWLYTMYTPLLGITLGGCIVTLGVGAVKFTKRFTPEEISAQRRHDGPSEEVDRKTIVALLNDSQQTSALGRRPVIKGLLGTNAVLAGIGMILPIDGMTKDPWKPYHDVDVTGDGTLWATGWTLVEEGERVYLGRDTGVIAEEGEYGYTTKGVSRPVRMRPEDLLAGVMETVFPLPAVDVSGSDKYSKDADVYEHYMHSIRGSRNSVMLTRLRVQDAEKAALCQGQEDFHYGDYFAFSKICTHIGCPTSSYEQQTNRVLCPCHQSQFDTLHYGKLVFGPAARTLPQLPISVDEEDYMYAKGNFVEPVGPAFWECQL